ncbi:MAG: hypothetical protein AABW89_05915 [Nanoarchaeota archaeon]
MRNKQEPMILGTNKEGARALSQRWAHSLFIGLGIFVMIIGLIGLIISKVFGILFIIFAILIVYFGRKWFKPVTGKYWKNH